MSYEDEGFYSCVAGNTLGETVSSAFLEISKASFSVIDFRIATFSLFAMLYTFMPHWKEWSSKISSFLGAEMTQVRKKWDPLQCFRLCEKSRLSEKLEATEACSEYCRIFIEFVSISLIYVEIIIYEKYFSLLDLHFVP